MPEERPDLSTGGVESTTAMGANALGTPIRGYRFTATFDGLGTASFKSVEGFSVEVQTTDYREGAFGRLTVRKLPGLVTFPDITLTKGLYNDPELYRFFSSYLEGTTLTPVNAVVRAFDNAGTVTASWSVKHAWPSRYESSGLNADSSDVIIETLTLVNEGISRDLTPQA
ncbi:MAG: phage tail protein [Oscillospiraceae bacterium]|jgi:phage tail-like protein|nr:phage tail protein [Oscillospiraceae bacterium]